MTDVAAIGNNALNIDKYEYLTPKHFAEHPFQKMLDSAVESLGKISATEANADALAVEYVNGNASIEDVMFAQNKAALEMNLAVTSVTSAIQTFKEITQLPV